jgi:hypothetical protein
LSKIERILVAAGLATLIVLAWSTWLNIRDVRTGIVLGGPTGMQNITTEVETPSGPGTVSTDRNVNEALGDWLDRHEAAIAAAEGG